MQDVSKFNVVVIGGGPAGVTAALRARELGASAALVERDRLGGACTNDGCVPTRVLAKAARLMRDSEQYADYGIEPVNPELVFSRLMSRVQHQVYRVHEKKQIQKSLEEAGVRVYQEAGSARFADPNTVVMDDGTRLAGDKFIICAGGHARRLNFPGAEYALTHSDVWSLKTLPRSVAIVGGAATGCQLASVFDTFGSRVTILESSPHILGREDVDVGRTLTDSFLLRNIHIVSGISGVERIEKSEGGLALHYNQNREMQIIEAEAVIMAVGWPGNSDELNLEAAGASSERGYVRVNDYFQTEAEHIFAAGDITGRMMLVQSAGYQGRVAAENAVLGPGQRHKHLIVPHGGFTDPEYASVGLTEAEARENGEYVVGMARYAELDRALIDGRSEGFCKLIVSAETHRLLGAHVVGEQALEIVHLVAAGMAAGMWVEQLAELEIAYPTYTAVVGLAARRVVRQLGVMPLSAEWRALGKHVAEWESNNEESSPETAGRNLMH